MTPFNPEAQHGRVLVIGGAGFIGSALLPRLLEVNWKVRILDLLLWGKQTLGQSVGHPDVELVAGDFRDLLALLPALRNVDAVIHLGGIVGDPACDFDPALTMDVNLAATRTVVEAARGMGVKRFIFASTALVYGASPDLLDESSVICPLGLYARTKLASERVLLDLAGEDFSPTILRVTTVYGLSGRARFDLVVNLLTAKAVVDGEITIFGGEQRRSFVHVEDAARAFALALQAPPAAVDRQIFNLGSNEQSYSVRQIGEMVQHLAPASRLVVTPDAVDPTDFRIRCSKIDQVLGFRPNWTVEDGIRQVIDRIDRGDLGDYRQAAYSNVKHMKEGGRELFSDPLGNWAERRIADLA